MSHFTPESPLGRKVQAILLDASEGLTLIELRQQLRRSGGFVSEENLRTILSDRRTFRLLPGDRYALTVLAPPSRVTPKPIDLVPQTGESKWDQPLIFGISRAASSYVVIDLETTGIAPEHDRIVQIAALKVVDHRPVALRNWYVHQGSFEIPYSVRLLIGANDPAVTEAIEAAPSLAIVLTEFLEFVETLPLVAHNARFDMHFLEQALVVSTNAEALPSKKLAAFQTVIDTMELALLLVPKSRNHQLATLADMMNISLGETASLWATLVKDGVPTHHALSVDTLHNAVTDVWLLHHVYESLLVQWHSESDHMSLIRALLPEAFSENTQYDGISLNILTPLKAECAWLEPQSPVRKSESLPETTEILKQYLAHKFLEPRHGQSQMCTVIAQALSQSAFSMVEAPTGTGKTLAYLSAAVHHARITRQPVALSTAYRNLQDQLVSEIQDLQAHGPVSFNSQLLKGVSNYFCWSQIEHFLLTSTAEPQSLALSPAIRFVLSYIVVWLPQSLTGSIDDVSYWVLETFPVARHVIRQLVATGACDPQLQPSCTACPMPSAYHKAQDADIIVINHALWLSEARRLPGFSALILDEAHTLEDVATSALAEEVSSQTLQTVLGQLFDPRTNRGLLPRLRTSHNHASLLDLTAKAIGVVRHATKLTEQFGTFLVQFIRRCTNRVDPKYGASLRLEAPPWKIHAPSWRSVDDAHQQLFGLYLGDLRNLLEQLLEIVISQPSSERGGGADRRDLSDLTRTIREQRALAYEQIKVNDCKRAYWVEVGPPQDPTSDERDSLPRSWALKSAPINIGMALEPFYEQLASVHFVSATLALRGNDFSYFVERLGVGSRLANQFLRQLPPALPYEQNVFLALTDFLTYTPLASTMESFKEELAKELALFLRFTDGRALGLFTARERMESVAKAITPILADHGIPIYMQTPTASRGRLLEAFKERNEAVLFGLRSFWEGIDAPGETLSFVLMEKLPFPLLIEPIHRARAEQLMTEGKSEFEDYLLPLMLLLFKQGFGRLMRRATDQGAILLYDKRIHRKSYKADLLASLPGYLPRNEQDERSRRHLYEAIATTFPTLIDITTKAELLESIPESLLVDFESTLLAYQLPQQVSSDQYEIWRPRLVEALRALFGHADFRITAGVGAQEMVVRALLAGQDVMGVLPTGSGKSLTFQLPALLRQGVTLVFSPLIALMKDQVLGLNERGIEIVGAVYSGQSASERDDVLERMQSGHARLVYISPERLRDPRLLETLRQTRVIQVVVDEAHCVYMWGPSFRPDFLYLPHLFKHLGYRPPLLALTATATQTMQMAIIDTLEMQDVVRVEVPINRPELQFVVYNATSRYQRISSRNDRFRQLLRILNAADRERVPILIYVATTVEAEQLATYLKKIGHDARAYHGKMDPRDRASVQELFMDDHINIVVCTKAFGMGIDKPNIRYVIHYNMPGDLESYFQEAGRAGRDGQVAYCILLYHASDVKTQDYFIKNGMPDSDTINRVLNHLNTFERQTIYLDPDYTSNLLSLEDVQLRVALHHLEVQGFLRRSHDFTLSGTVTWQQIPSITRLAWQQDQEAYLDWLDRLLASTDWMAYRKTEIDLLRLAEQVGLTPEEIDILFIRLAQRREIAYTPWRRGFVVVRAGELESISLEKAGDLATELHRSALTQKLQAMIAYATNSGTCRRNVILAYFDQDTTIACSGCDGCEPEREWTWSLVTERDAVTPDHYFDSAFILLEIIHWNLTRMERYGAPFGIGTLLAILKGNEYAAIRYETDPYLRKWRLQQVRNCPYWGIFALMESQDRLLQATLERLEQEGFVTREQQLVHGGTGYTYLALTPKGTAQLTSGQLLQWELA